MPICFKMIFHPMSCLDFVLFFIILHSDVWYYFTLIFVLTWPSDARKICITNKIVAEHFRI